MGFDLESVRVYVLVAAPRAANRPVMREHLDNPAVENYSHIRNIIGARFVADPAVIL
jgi:hypothetical protein